MQISRSIPLAFAAIVFLAPLFLNAQTAPRKGPTNTMIAPPPADPALIEKAREAMRQRMAEPETGQQPAAQPGQASVPAVPAEPPVATPKPEPVTAVPKVEPQPTQPAAVESYTLKPSDHEAARTAKEILAEEEKARIAAEKEQRRQAIEAEKVKAAAEKRLRQQNAEEEKARIAEERAARRKAAEAEKERLAAEKAAARQASKAKDSPAFTTPNLAPSTVPTMAMPTTKEQRLQQLLNDYKADKISPQEFHERRAKILAE